MYTVQEANGNDLLLKELEECLINCRHCNCLATVKQAMITTEGNINLTNISETQFDVTAFITINNNRFYVRLETNEPIEIKKVLAFRDTVNERGTQKFLRGQDNDYIFVVDLIKENEQENLVYIMSFVSPLFMTTEDGGLYAVYDFDNMHFSRDEVDFVDVLNEIEYAEEIEKFALEREGEQEQDFDENEEYIGNDELLSTNTDNDYID